MHCCRLAKGGIHIRRDPHGEGCGQPLGAGSSPWLEASKETGISILQLKGNGNVFRLQPMNSEKNPKSQRKTVTMSDPLISA